MSALDHTFLVLSKVDQDHEQYKGITKFRFSTGDRVLVYGLKVRRRWNKQDAMIIGEYQEASGRWPIRLQSTGEQGLVKNTNLMGYIFGEAKEEKKMEDVVVRVAAKTQARINHRRCGYCLKKRGDVWLWRCRNCKEHLENEYVVRYCDDKCQKRDWPNHKNHCGAL